jgi:hypothetical protein
MAPYKYTPQTASNEESLKRIYAAPKLIRFGMVADLTQNGTAAVTEGNNDGSMGNIMGSSIVLKENITRIGTHPLGVGLYLFDYKPEYRDQWGHGRQFGVMAEEVEAVMPEAVALHTDGYKMANYALLGIERSIH